MDCYTLEQIDDYVRGVLHDTARARFESHVLNCSPCRDRVRRFRTEERALGELGALGPQDLLGCIQPAGAHPSWATVRQVQQLYGTAVDPGISLDRERGAAPEPGGSDRSPAPGVRRAADRYRVQELVGQGGMGTVLGVWDTELRRRLAMKIRGRLDDPPSGEPGDWRSARRFLREAQITAQLDHPGIVPVHEIGLDEKGRLFFTMKRVEGQTLTAVLRQVELGQDGWTQTRALGVLVKVCEAVAYAHTKGVIHRDLKPSNVMVGGFGEVYVMDWGLAKMVCDPAHRDGEPALESSPEVEVEREHGPAGPKPITIDGMALGTPAYMPPEQALGDVQAVNQRSDVYSLGAMLYHLLTGRVPYAAAEDGLPAKRVVEQTCEGPPVSVHELRPKVAPELVAICEKAMERDPRRRYAGPDEMALDLQAYLEGRVVRAYAVGPVVELKKWVVRNRTVAATVLTAALVLVLVTIGFIVRLVREQAETQENYEAARWESYAARMVAARSYRNDGEMTEMAAELDTCPVEHRGWEWEHLNLQRNLPLAAHESALSAPCLLTYSRDGTLFYGLDAYGLHTWDAGTAELMGVVQGPGTMYRAAAIHPESHRVASVGYEDPAIVVWDARTGERLDELSGGLPHASQLAFTPSGKRLLSLHAGDRLALWDLESSSVVHDFAEVELGVVAVALSPDGERMVFADRIGNLFFCDTETGGVEQENWAALGSIQGLALSPDGERVVVLREFETLEVIHVESGATLLELEGHEGFIDDLAIRPDGEVLASASRDGTIRLWNLFSGTVQATLSLDEEPEFLAFSPCSTRLISANAALTVWDGGAQSYPIVRPLQRHSEVDELVVSHDGTRIALYQRGDANVQLWDATCENRIGLFACSREGIKSLLFGPRDELLILGGVDGVLRAYDIESGEIHYETGGFEGLVVAELSEDGSLLAVGADKSKRIGLFNATTGEVLNSWDLHSHAEDIEIDTGLGRIYSALCCHHVECWSLEGELLYSIETSDTRPRIALGFGGTRLASTTGWGELDLWDTEAGEHLLTLYGHESTVTELIASPDGARFFSGSMDQDIRVWDSATGRLLMPLRKPTPAGLLGHPFGMAIAPQGDVLVCGDWGKLTYWESDLSRASARWGGPSARDRARYLLPGLFEEHLFLDAVNEELLADTSLSVEVREVALVLARDWDERSPAYALNQRAWAAVAYEDKPVDNYAAGLRWARRACGLEGEDASFRRTLGLALIRVGSYEEALQELREAETIEQRSPDAALSTLTPLFQAMAHHHLGRPDEARGLLDVVDEGIAAMESGWERSMVRAFREEARQLFGLPAPEEAHEGEG